MDEPAVPSACRVIVMGVVGEESFEDRKVVGFA